MYIYIHISTYIHMHIHIHVHTSLHNMYIKGGHVYTHIHILSYIYIHTYKHIVMHICKCVNIPNIAFLTPPTRCRRPCPAARTSPWPSGSSRCCAMHRKRPHSECRHQTVPRYGKNRGW